MKKSIFFASLLASSVAIAQTGRVGINTQDPKTTLDVVAKKGTTDKDGLLPPRLTLAELNSKTAGTYGVDQDGTLVYVSEIGTASGTGQTIQISEPGYYYFDKNSGTTGQWVKFAFASDIIPAAPETEPWFVQNTSNQATGNTQNIYQTGSVAIGRNNAFSATKLHVQGAGTVNTAWGSQLVLTDNGSTNALMGFHIDGLYAGFIGLDRGTSNFYITAANGNAARNGMNHAAFLIEAADIAGTGGGFIGMNVQNPTERLDVGGNARIRELLDGSTFTNVVVADANGVLGKSTVANISSAAEPWHISGTMNKATSNTQNIYQTGSVALGGGVNTHVDNTALRSRGLRSEFGIFPNDPDVNSDRRSIILEYTGGNGPNGMSVGFNVNREGLTKGGAGNANANGEFTSLNNTLALHNNTGVMFYGLETGKWQFAGITKADVTVRENFQLNANTAFTIDHKNKRVGVGAAAVNPTEALDVAGNAKIRNLVDGNQIADFPRSVVAKADGTLGYMTRQATTRTTLVAPGTPFAAINTIGNNEVVAASGNFNSVQGGLLYFLGDAQLSVNNAAVTVGFSLWIDGVRRDEIKQYFETATKIGFNLSFIIPDIPAGAHTWQLKFNGNVTADNNSFVNANHRYQLKLTETSF